MDEYTENIAQLGTDRYIGQAMDLDACGIGSNYHIPTSVARSAIAEYREREMGRWSAGELVQKRTIFGLDSTINIENVSHCIESIWLHDRTIRAIIKRTGTYSGKLLREYVESRLVKLNVRWVGVTEISRITHMEIITVDAVMKYGMSGYMFNFEFLTEEEMYV